jgi:hypothetical protein
MGQETKKFQRRKDRIENETKPVTWPDTVHQGTRNGCFAAPDPTRQQRHIQFLYRVLKSGQRFLMHATHK